MMIGQTRRTLRDQYDMSYTKYVKVGVIYENNDTYASYVVCVLYSVLHYIGWRYMESVQSFLMSSVAWFNR